MKTVLSFIATSWLLLEVLYTIIERYNWNLFIFDGVLGLLVIVGVSLLTRSFLHKRITLGDSSYKKILLVEDEGLVRQLICDKLKKERSFQITHEAKNGKEALMLLKKHKFDMVITDIDMPEMNGLELCKIIKRDFPAIKVLTLTMFNGTDQLKSIVNSGASGYLDKEFLDTDINSAINAVINGGCYYSKHVLTLFQQIFGRKEELTLAHC
ncbi:MAG: response regulator transcription factor [Cyclobacteriaceae bacterium]